MAIRMSHGESRWTKPQAALPQTFRTRAWPDNGRWRRLRISVIPLVVAISVGACGASKGASSPNATGTNPRTTTAPTAASSAFPAGVYRMTLAPEELSGHAVRPGEYELQLTADGHRLIKIPGGIERTSTYTVDKDRVTFTADTVGECTSSATYHWAFAGTALTFTAQTPDCDRRQFTTTVHPWIKAG